ncbi:MAG: RsbRD N-terminal domain-containing protein [Deltaproteobacteria bacterium]|nr:RsbRD N-terminal domain-containing protein [Deltaproteobacteria bacterium]
MGIENLLLKKRTKLLDTWFTMILEGYPPETSIFFKSEKDRFSNPIAYQISEGITGIYDALSQGKSPVDISPFLSNIVKIMAVQELSPSESVSFISLLKKIVREELKGDPEEDHMADELLRFESKLDELTFISFDVYMKHREKLFELKVKDAKNRVGGLLRMAGLAVDLEEATDCNDR